MKISSTTIEKLANFIIDNPYRSGPILVELFNEFCSNKDTYCSGFPSRIKYAREKINELNGSKKLKFLIEEVFHICHFEQILFDLKKTATDFNKFLSKDGYFLEIQTTKMGIIAKVNQLNDGLIKLDDLNNPDEFIKEQIEKCRTKITSLPPDIDGAITNARSLLEAIMEFCLREIKVDIPKHSGNILNLYKSIKQHFHLGVNKDHEEPIKQVLAGLSSILTGLAGISNELSDRHVRRCKLSLYHAELAVNVSFTLSKFLTGALEQIKSEKQNTDSNLNSECKNFILSTEQSEDYDQ